MEKRNLIEQGRTPGLDKRGSDDELEKAGLDAFRGRAAAPRRKGHPDPAPFTPPCGGTDSEGRQLY